MSVAQNDRHTVPSALVNYCLSNKIETAIKLKYYLVHSESDMAS